MPKRITLRLVLKTVLILGLAVIFLVYLLYQGRFVIAGPVIELYNEPPPTVYENPLLLQGNVKNATVIDINDRPIVTTKDGDFKNKVYLQSGYNIVTISAKDRYGRRTSEVRKFVYQKDNN